VAIELVSETFAPHVGEAFEVAPTSGDAFEAVLSNCEETPYGDAQQWRDGFGRVPFSLLFHHEAASTAIPQQTCRLRHPELGELELFLVPLGPDERGMRYEAVVS
jgi:hypothetical protein